MGPVGISEIHYHPPPDGTNANTRDEFLELCNGGASPWPLYDPLFPKGRDRCYWKSTYLKDLEDGTIRAILRGLAGRPSEKTFADQLAEAMYHHHNGMFSRALALLDSLDPMKLSPVEQVRFTCRRALARFEAGLVSHSELPELESELELARTRLQTLGDDEVGADMRPWLVDLIEAGRAWCALKSGDVPGAELRTQARLSRLPNLPEALAFLVRVLEEQGDPGRAEFVRSEALRHAHPESFLAQQLGRTPAPDGGPYR